MFSLSSQLSQHNWRFRSPYRLKLKLFCSFTRTGLINFSSRGLQLRTHWIYSRPRRIIDPTKMEWTWHLWLATALNRTGLILYQLAPTSIPCAIFLPWTPWHQQMWNNKVPDSSEFPAFPYVAVTTVAKKRERKTLRILQFDKFNWHNIK